MAEEAAAAPEEEKKKGGAKKLIIKIIPLVLIALVVLKMTVLKPPPLTAAQKDAKAKAAKETLATKCAIANGLTPPPAADSKSVTTTTVEAAPTPAASEGAVLTADSVTINLADGHFLKVGIGLQLPPGVVIDTPKNNNAQAGPLNYVITQLRTKTMGELGPNALEPLREKLGNQICNDTDAEFLTVYFTDFVSQ